MNDTRIKTMSACGDMVNSAHDSARDEAYGAQQLHRLYLEHVKQVEQMLLQLQEHMRQLVMKGNEQLAYSLVQVLRDEQLVVRCPCDDGRSHQASGPVRSIGTEAKTKQSVGSRSQDDRLGPYAVQWNKEPDQGEDIWRESQFRADDLEDAYDAKAINAYPDGVVQQSLSTSPALVKEVGSTQVGEGPSSCSRGYMDGKLSTRSIGKNVAASTETLSSDLSQDSCSRVDKDRNLSTHNFGQNVADTTETVTLHHSQDSCSRVDKNRKLSTRSFGRSAIGNNPTEPLSPSSTTPSLTSDQAKKSNDDTGREENPRMTVEGMMNNLQEVKQHIRSSKNHGGLVAVAAGRVDSFESPLEESEGVSGMHKISGPISPKVTLSYGSMRVKPPWLQTLERVMHSSILSNFITGLIIANAVLIGLQTEWSAQNIGKKEPDAFESLGLIFNLIFIAELFLRLICDGVQFFTSKDYKWNVFDLIIVISAMCEIVLRFFDNQDWKGGTALRALRMLRLVRTIRAIRVMQCFRELRLVVFGIMNSMVSLLWLLMLLVFIMFIFGVYITQMVVEEREAMALQVRAGDPLEDGESELAAKLELHYSSMSSTFYTLFASIAGGMSWVEVSSPLFQLSPIVGFLFVFYIAFVVFAVLNVVTGVFVDNAHKAAESDVDHVVLEETAERMKNIESVQKVFMACDKDRSGELSREEFQKHVLNPCVQAYFQMINLDFETFGADRLFDLLDFDGGGQVDVNEFVVGCTKLRGLAKSLDMAILHHDVKKIDKKLCGMEQMWWITERRVLEACGVEDLPGNMPTFD